MEIYAWLFDADVQIIPMTNISAIRILFSNLGYARGINGALKHHLLYAHRNFYCTATAQNKVLQQLKALLTHENPDLCCFVEIDQGSFSSGGLNQLTTLVNQQYAHAHIANKYSPSSRLSTFFLTKGKSNAYLSKQNYPHQLLYFSHGYKRLIYRIQVEPRLTLFFAHFSLNKLVRAQQLRDMKILMRAETEEVILFGDFNILTGFSELDVLLQDTPYVLLNRPDQPTFTFHRKRLVLDLCICSPGIASRAALKIIPQPYSDHAALLLELST